MVPLCSLGARLGALRLCSPEEYSAIKTSLACHGQLVAVVVFELAGQLEVLDGLKRLRAARELDWDKLRVERCELDGVQAKISLLALHRASGLTELEEAWVVRALCREDGLSQVAIAKQLGRDKSWVCRRLMLAEALHSELQSRVQLGLMVARSAVAVCSLPHGNQVAASDIVMAQGLTVRQTESMVAQLLECSGDIACQKLIRRWKSEGLTAQDKVPKPKGPMRGEGDWVLSEIGILQRIAVKLQTRLLGHALLTLNPKQVQLLIEGLKSLQPVLLSLAKTISDSTSEVALEGERS
jgi:ParB/RepB/Spo0J family partition protein